MARKRSPRDESERELEEEPQEEEEVEEEEASARAGINMEGLPSWLISCAVHMLLLFLLAFLVIGVTEGEQVLFHAQVQLPPEKMEVPPPPPVDVRPVEVKSNPNVPTQAVTVANPIITREQVEITEDRIETPNEVLKEEDSARGEASNYDLVDGGGSGPGVMGLGAGGQGGFGNGQGQGRGNGTGNGAGAFGRPTGSGRLARAQAGGGGRETEGALDRALEWLKRHQSSDGHWDARAFGAMSRPRKNVVDAIDYDVAVTGLAVLAFLGAGYTHEDGSKFAGTLRSALYWLEEHQDQQTGKWPGSHYGQGIASLAAAEAYGMTQAFRNMAQKAMDYLAFAQNPNGGWNYHTTNITPLGGRDRSDTSITGWQVMAAKSGMIAGLRVSPAIFEGARRYFGQVGAGDYEAGGEGQVRYFLMADPRQGGRQREGVSEAAGSDAITAIAMLCLQFMGSGRDNPWMQQKADQLMETGVAPNNFYYLYYATLAMFNMGGERWQAWNEQLKPRLTGIQVSGGDNDGSWDPGPLLWGPFGGRVYSTALGAMILEVYYRYLPVYGENR